MEKIINKISDAVKNVQELYIMHDNTDICDNGDSCYTEHEDDCSHYIRVHEFYDLQEIMKDCTLMYDNYVFVLEYDKTDNEFYIYGFPKVD